MDNVVEAQKSEVELEGDQEYIMSLRSLTGTRRK